MNYLVVSCTLYDGGGFAMIQGFINGIRQYDKNAHVHSLHQKEHHRDGLINSFIEPRQNDEAFQWADVIVDIAGFHTNQGNKYTWRELRNKYKKPYIFASQSFKKSVDKSLLDGCAVVARGKGSAFWLWNAGIEDFVIAPDLSFLVEPEEVKNDNGELIRPRYVFSTHFTKNCEYAYDVCDSALDVQVVEKMPRGNEIYEQELPCVRFTGSPEQHFGLINQCVEVHAARYQIMCGAILCNKPLSIFVTGKEEYDEKYADLFDFRNKTKTELLREALVTCKIAYNLAGKGK